MRTRIQLRVTPEAYAALEQYAEQHGLTISDVLREGAARLTGKKVIREIASRGYPSHKNRPEKPGRKKS